MNMLKEIIVGTAVVVASILILDAVNQGVEAHRRRKARKRAQEQAPASEPITQTM